MTTGEVEVAALVAFEYVVEEDFAEYANFLESPVKFKTVERRV
jgi:hypothetical protein